MNHRQQTLQGIIKSQQAKIQQLREEMRVITEIGESRIGNISTLQQQQLKEKDLMIQYLRMQLDSVALQQSKIRNLQSGLTIEQRQAYEQQIHLFRNSVDDLQSQLTAQKQTYELQISEMNRHKTRLEQELKHIEKSKQHITHQVAKLNNFYRNALYEIPKRKETLLWVDKLIQYMDKADIQQQKHHKELYSFMRNSLQTIKEDTLAAISADKKHQEAILREKQQINSVLSDLIEDSKSIYQKVLDENSKFWNQLSENKENKLKQQCSHQEQEIKRLELRYSTDIAELRDKLKHVEVEKKTLTVGFQSLKNLHEEKEKNYRKQITFLKQKIEDLLETAEGRQKEFDQEMKIISTQIQAISERYYENIEIPIHKVNHRLESQVSNVMDQLSKLQESTAFKQSLKRLEEVMLLYLSKSNDSASFYSEIGVYAKKNCEVIENIMKDLIQETVVGERGMETMVLKISNRINVVEEKEKESRLTYEINLLKKHNMKLQEYCTKLEKQKGQSHQNARTITLQNQLEYLKVWSEDRQRLLMDQIYMIREEIGQLLPKDTTNHTTKLQVIKKYNEEILDFLQMEAKHMNQMAKSMNLINNMLIRPVETFELLVKEVATATQAQSQSKNQTFSTSKLERKEARSNINQYKELLMQRQQNVASTQKVMNQLLRAIRESHPPKIHEKGAPKPSEELQEPHLKNKERNLQKRVKQLQQQRIKDRHEIVTRMQKIDATVKKIEQKYQKKSRSVHHGRLDEVIEKKILELFDKISEREANPELHKIALTAYKDMESKLSESIIENEGLMKELSVFQILKT